MFLFQINKVYVREVNRGPDYSPRFELERREDGRREVLRTDEISGAKNTKPEVGWIVVQVGFCETLLQTFLLANINERGSEDQIQQPQN